MNSIIQATNLLYTDEPCFGLSERNLLSADGKSSRRIQIVHIVRNDIKAECRIDLGPSEAFDADEFSIMTSIDTDRGEESCHTVIETLDMATAMRAMKTDHEAARIKHVEETRANLVGRSVFGPVFKIQREGVRNA